MSLLTSDGQVPIGAASVASDTTSSRLFIKPSANDENAITVKRPSSTWGVSQAYGKGQVFVVLKDAVAASDIGYTGVTPDDFIIFRIDKDGNLGLTGGIHIDTGLRQATGYTASYALGITPAIDTTLINLKLASGATSAGPFIYGADSGAVEKFRIKIDGTGIFGEGTGTGAGKGMAIGSNGNGSTSYFAVAHSDRLNTTDYALQQGPNGDTYLNAAASQMLHLRQGNTTFFSISTAGAVSAATDFKFTGSKIGFFNTAVASKQTVSGSRGGNAALASLLTALATYGLVTDSSTA